MRVASVPYIAAKESCALRDGLHRKHASLDSRENPAGHRGQGAWRLWRACDQRPQTSCGALARTRPRRVLPALRTRLPTRQLFDNRQGNRRHRVFVDLFGFVTSGLVLGVKRTLRPEPAKRNAAGHEAAEIT
jgi:hypothetical protein